MGWRTVLALAVLTVAPVTVGAQPGRSGADDRVRIQAGGNELTVRRTGPVPYSAMDQLTAEIERPLSGRVSAIRLRRASPPQMIDYVFCITREGTLVLGQQMFDLGAGRPSFSRGEIARAYPRLERPGPWAWIIDIPLGREASAALELRATAEGWPVRSVTISVDRVQ